MYISKKHHQDPNSDFMTHFSENLSNDLLTNTLSSGITDSNKALKDAGLTLQNNIINKGEIDQEGRKLIQEYDEALENTQEVAKTVEEQSGSQKKGNWGNEERRLTQVYYQPPVQQVQAVQPVTLAQPQYVYSQVGVPNQPVYQVAPPQNIVTPPPTQQIVTPMTVPQNQNVVNPPSKIEDKQKTISKTEVTKEIKPKPVKKKETKSSVEAVKVSKKSNVKKIKNTLKKGNRFLWRWKRRGPRPRPRRRRWWERRKTHAEIMQERKNLHQWKHGHTLLHNHHPVNSQAFHNHNENYYRNRFDRKYNPHFMYNLKKVRHPKNIRQIKSILATKLRKAKIHMMSREKFDTLREYKVKSAAELWNRTFIYDSVLMIERDLYDTHKQSVQEKMEKAAQVEAKVTADINEFYNKYYEKDPEKIKEEDLIHHIFV
jgi:hypothetical protein